MEQCHDLGPPKSRWWIILPISCVYPTCMISHSKTYGTMVVVFHSIHIVGDVLIV
ncbi:hypothetical protein IC582_006052 [Cucumis melo]